MDTNLYEFEGGEERSTGVEVRAQAPASRFPGRHDAPLSKLSPIARVERATSAESQLREDCGGELNPAHSASAAAGAPYPGDPVSAGVVHSSARPLLLEYGERHTLVVRRESLGGSFVLRTFKNGVEQECVKARDAQAVIDYIAGTWPVGTTIQWIVAPPPLATYRNFTDRVYARERTRVLFTPASFEA
jgi:hypothetical protein